MDTKQIVLERLRKADGSFVSGEEIARDLSLSRMAVSKAVSSLRDKGYIIESMKHRGYRLDTRSDVYSEEAISSILGGSPIRVVFLDETVSTNMDAKRLVAEGMEPPFLVAAASQKGGRGRLGRSFESPRGGVYFSLVLKGDKISSPSLLTISAAWAVSSVMERLTGIETGIKWVNDVYIGEKKAVGILSEGIVNMEEGGLSAVVVGCGINLKTKIEEFPEELRGKVTSFYPEGKGNVSRALVTAECAKAIVEAQEKPFIDEYRKKCFVIGRRISVVRMGKEKEALATGLTDQGHLIVKYSDGSTEVLSTGEVSILV